MNKYFSLSALATLFLATACGPTATGDDSSHNNIESTVGDHTSVIAPSPEATSLVVYFSCTGTTERIANLIANVTGSPTHQIVPLDPYTDEDLIYYDSDSRSMQEQDDPSARPEIANEVSDFANYELFYLGYPIWYGDAPRIISTFLESYDFSGKTIVPFCTSGSSPMSTSATELAPLAPGATWLAGRRFAGNATSSDVENWLTELGLITA